MSSAVAAGAEAEAVPCPLPDGLGARCRDEEPVRLPQGVGDHDAACHYPPAPAAV